MAARKTTAELLAEYDAKRAEVLAKDGERKEKRKTKIAEEDKVLIEKIEVLQGKRQALAVELDELNTSSTPVDEV